MSVHQVQHKLLKIFMDFKIKINIKNYLPVLFVSNSRLKL